MDPEEERDIFDDPVLGSPPVSQGNMGLSHLSIKELYMSSLTPMNIALSVGIRIWRRVKREKLKVKLSQFAML